MGNENKTLRISDDFALPLDAATRRLAILAMSGAGKSNVAVVMAEAMFDAGIPWVAIDGKGDWWGVRSAKNGKGPGLPIPIFGGLHGDIPLEAGAGKFIADLIIDQRLTCVLDVSESDDRQGMWGFLRDFGETLLRRNRQALHVFLEEADEYLPQKANDKGNLPKCLGTWQRVVKRGRFRGIGTTQITQRSASLNKDTLYQAELLIAMRVTGKGDRDAIKGWVDHHNAADEIVASLPTLADGEGWVTSPAWLRETRRVRFLRRRTFDSGGTPVLVEGNSPPATLADVDIKRVSAQMAETIERAKANDPAELRKRIIALEKQLRDQKPPPAPKPEIIEKPVVTDAQVKRVEGVAARLEAEGKRRIEAGDRLAESGRELVATARDFIGALTRAAAPVTPRAKTRESIPIHTPAASRAPRPSSGVAVAEGTLPRGERAVLTAIAQYEDGAERDQLSVLTGYKRSSRDAYIQRLRERGLIDQSGDRLVATTEGVAALGHDFEPLPSGEALRDYWIGRLPEGERRVLEVLIEAHPEAVAREWIDERTGYKRSSRDAYLQRLSSRRLVESVGRGEVKASDQLFD